MPLTTHKLWRCPACRRGFANRNQRHSCSTLRSLGDHFSGKPAGVRAIFDRVRSTVSACGPVTVLPEKTRIAFHARMSFMVVSVQRSGLRGHFVFASVHRHPRFVRITTYSPRNHVHEFRLTSPSEVDDTFRAWVAQAYRVGSQAHLGERRTPRPTRSARH